MTLLMAGALTTIALSVCAIFGMFVDKASDRARAQAAADAAALASVAESVPGATGSHHDQARRFAEANGATLLACECELGSTSVEVMVAVDGVRARARATLDPNAFLPLAMGIDPAGLDPLLATSVERLVSASRGAVRLVSGWRSPQRQQELWSAALIRYGDPETADDWVARPGSSMHERGLAVDLGGDLELAAALIARLDLPLHRPLPHEPWHFELSGSR